MSRRRPWLGALVLLLLAGCQSTASELSGLAATAPLDYAVLVTGGAFLVADPGHGGTFTPADPAPDATPPADDERIAIDEIIAVLDEGRVFRRVAREHDDARRRSAVDAIAAGAGAAELQQIVQRARDDGFDFLLVVEELRDGPIEKHGINGRWPVTLATWVLLGVGALIPDHTFESRATLRISVRDLQTGLPLHDPLLPGGPIDLALTERTDVLGLLTSIVVPPFWVGTDVDTLRGSVQAVTKRRLLVQLARDLKSAAVRQRLRERSAAAFSLLNEGDGDEIVVESAQSLSAVRLRAEPPLPAAAAQRFTADMLASLESREGRFRYRAALPAEARGRLIQVLVATIRGAVASATFTPGAQ